MHTPMTIYTDSSPAGNGWNIQIRIILEDLNKGTVTKVWAGCGEGATRDSKNSSAEGMWRGVPPERGKRVGKRGSPDRCSDLWKAAGWRQPTGRESRE